MAAYNEKYYNRKINTSYITSVISITLVLFVLGFLGMFLMHARSLSNYIKENIGFEIIMNDNVKEADIVFFQKQLNLNPAVKTTEYITREEATRRLSDVLGEDFTGFIDDENNPLLPSIEVRFKADWANNDSIAKVENQIIANEGVKEVYYQKSVVHLINSNLRRITFALLIVSIMLFFISIALINNTIRLSIYSKRFIIRTMLLVGASDGFIVKPFISGAVIQGLIGSLFSMTMLYGILVAVQSNIPELALLTSTQMLIYLNVFILLAGLLITVTATYIAVQRYLRLNSDALYG